MTAVNEPNLFKSPTLSTEDKGESEARRPIADLPLFTDLDEATRPAPQIRAPHGHPGVTPETVEAAEIPAVSEPVSRPIHGPARLTDRLGAALLDVAVMVAVAIALPLGAAVLGAAPRANDWPLIAIPWVLFSFLYHVVPMAFWGRTPGMASLRLTARSLDGGPLSFDQAVRRWLSTLATVALVGLPGLLALSGRSATDRLSRSSTFWGAPESPPGARD